MYAVCAHDDNDNSGLPQNAYSLKASGMCEAFIGMLVLSREATAFHVNSIRMLMATLSKITILFHMSLQNKRDILLVKSGSDHNKIIDESVECLPKRRR